MQCVDTSMGVWVVEGGRKMIVQNLYAAELKWSWIFHFL